MQTIEIKNIQNELVLYFDSKEKSVNAYTLATALVSLADAAKEANRLINPGYEIEVIVTAIEGGSFKAVIKAVYKELKNLFSAESARNIILSIIATMIYDKYFAQKPDIRINVSPDYVIVESKDEKIVIPKEVYDAKEIVVKSPRVSSKVDSLMQSSKRNKNVNGIGIASSVEEKPEIVIQKKEIEKIYNEPVIEEPNLKDNVEITNVEILRAILEESNRLWEFVWYGNKISAPVLDDHFYKSFREHKITIAPGDRFEVKMKVYQKKDEGSGIYINNKYEILEVIKHIPKMESIELIKN